VVLWVDEKSQIQALDRTQPILPLLPATPERATHDYKRHGTSSLDAALDLTTGKVLGALHRRHRAIEFKKFLKLIDDEVPAALDVRLVLDNSCTHKTPALQRWLKAHPRLVLRFTPTSSSWLNLVERWFAELTTKLLQRGAHRSVAALNRDIRAWIETWNDDPRPFVWTKPAEEILDSIRRYCERINPSGHLAEPFQFLEAQVRERDRHGALSDRCGHPLGRAVPYVTGCEEAPHAGLQRKRVPFCARRRSRRRDRAARRRLRRRGVATPSPARPGPPVR